MDDVLSVEVFPLAADRWVAVVAAPEGAFSTEVDRPEAVEHEVRSVVAQVLRVDTPRFALVDRDGQPRTLEIAQRQVQALNGSVPLPSVQSRLRCARKG